jgi:hypothetical protein
MSKRFHARQEALLIKKGSFNATNESRQRIDTGGEDDWPDDGASAATGVSRAPSLHPSVAVSEACSESTIGAGDDTEYWDFQHRTSTKKDLGHTCRECRLPFRSIGEALTERRGARISSRYHGACFSGFADPRSQNQSSHHRGKLRGTQMEAAPMSKATTKMRTGSHFEGGGSTRGGSMSMGGKHGAAMGIGNHGFGAQSSKGKQPPRGPGGFTEAELEAHDKADEPHKKVGPVVSAAGTAGTMERFLGPE